MREENQCLHFCIINNRNTVGTQADEFLRLKGGKGGVVSSRTIVVDPKYALKVSLTSTALSRVAQYSSTPKNSEGSAALLLSAALILVSWATHHSESSDAGHL